MRPTTIKTTPWILAILFLAAASQAFAEQARYIEERAYVGGFGLVASLSDEMNYGFAGTNGYITMDSQDYHDLALTPKIKANYGFGGLVGYRRGDYAVELSYCRSEHKAEYKYVFVLKEYATTALFQSFNVDLKRFILTQFPVQPYVSMGMSFPWVVFKNAGNTYTYRYDTPDSWVYIKTSSQDVSYSGMGFNLGAGLELFATPLVSVTGGVVQRWAGYGNSKGADNKDRDLLNNAMVQTSLRDSSLGFHVGATISFH
jgi:hypothetical protein